MNGLITKRKGGRRLGFWKEVDMEIRNRMKTFKTSYDEEKEDAIKTVANERYGTDGYRHKSRNEEVC